jgi:hypothetical protein
MASKQSNEISQLIITAIALIAVLYAFFKATTNDQVRTRVSVPQSQN